MNYDDRPVIDPALGLDLVQSRTLASRAGTVSVVIPAHNEADSISDVVGDAAQALAVLEADGEVIVAASGCTDDTAEIAARSGARVVDAPAGKGNAIIAGIQASTADIICLIDGDFRYYGSPPLAASLVAPILRGLTDATIADLYWRPLYPQIWLYGFWAPLAGRLFPELVPKVGTTPWSGQRAAIRELWPDSLPAGFTSDLALLLHWNDLDARLRPIVGDDWMNPQRPKPNLLLQEFTLLTEHAVKGGRITSSQLPALQQWFATAHAMMAEYQPGTHDPQQFEEDLLERSFAALYHAVRLATPSATIPAVAGGREQSSTMTSVPSTGGDAHRLPDQLWSCQEAKPTPSRAAMFGPKAGPFVFMLRRGRDAREGASMRLVRGCCVRLQHVEQGPSTSLGRPAAFGGKHYHRRRPAATMADSGRNDSGRTGATALR